MMTVHFYWIGAIPAMIFYSLFRAKAARLISHLEAVSADLLTLIVHKKDV